MRNKELAIETLFNAINEKVKKNWDDGTLFHEANAGYQLP